MNVKHYIEQPTNSKVCGQTCIAMVLGISLEEAIKLYGHRKATSFNDHKVILERFGYTLGEFIKIDNRKGFDLPDLCLVRIVKANNKVGHFIIHDNGKFYDPSRGVFDSKEDLLWKYNHYHNGEEKHRKWKFDYYTEIKKQDLMMVAGVDEERKYRVIVGHDIFNTGTRHKMEKIMTESELENVRKSVKFEVIGYEAL